jgi:ATP-dependent DNA helicase RecQ
MKTPEYELERVKKYQHSKHGKEVRAKYKEKNKDKIANYTLEYFKHRREVAKEKGLPPYVIFHDSTLLEILNQRPQNLTEMSRISGVGQAKLERYGDDFIRVLNNASY